MPNRRCIFCKKIDEKKNFIRVVDTNGKLVFDENQKINARGMYFCDKKCIEKFINLNKKKKNNINLNNEDLLNLLETIK